MTAPKVYFWTFTFVETQPVWRSAAAWSALQRQLFDWFGKFRGIRVAEMHRLHGLHFHVLVDARLPVAVVRRLATRYGFGRIEVQAVRNKEAASRYLVKYLAKGESLPCPGMKRWTRIGGLGEPKNNFVCMSELAVITRKALADYKASNRGEITRSEQFKIIKTVRHAYDVGLYDREPEPGFVLHSGPMIDLTEPPKWKRGQARRSKPGKRRNQWSS